jgi:voltage-gated potassium channel
MAIVLLYGTLGAYYFGSRGDFNVAIHSPLDAFYFTITTISTVGYGDIVPVTSAAKAFAIVLIVSGLSVFLVALTEISGELMSSRIEKLSMRLSSVEKSRLKDHTVLVGYDSTNAALAEMLKEKKEHFMIITAEKTVADVLRERGYLAYTADYTLRSDMEKFNLQKAKRIIVDLKNSSNTIYVVLVVRKLAENVELFVVAPHTDTEAHLKDLGIENIVNPAQVAAKTIMGRR